MRRDSLFEQFTQATTEAEFASVQQKIVQEGYSAFLKFLDDFIEAIKSFRDEDAARSAELLNKARELFPEPRQFSPSWDKVWQELERNIAIKTRILQTIAPQDRDGEWQVIMDNPFLVQQVVCYPGLPFYEAAYLYAYFLPQIERNDYIRLQKIVNLVVENGGKS